ncbi:hypothetical protein V6Z11_D01G038700 [Gossypium hirsutum]
MTTVEPNKYVFKIEFLTKNCLLSYKGNILNYIPGKLFTIHALNLSHNHLTVILPVSLSNLSQVGSQDFSYNKLSGKIPSKLVNLNFLEVFSVAHNNISGRIPSNRQFATFCISNYEGNPFLCGLRLEKNHTNVIDMPFASDETEGKWYEIDRVSFFASFVATYCVFLLSFGVVSTSILIGEGDGSIYLRILFTVPIVVDTFHKLAINFNN